MRNKSLYRGSCCFILLLMASLGYGQVPSMTSVVGRAGAAGSHLATGVHTEAAQQTFCQVIVVPVKVPPSSVQIAQSNERFGITPTFDPNVTAAQRAVIQYAIDEWEAITLTRGFTPANYSIEFRNGPLSGPLAQAIVNVDGNTGNLNQAWITFNNAAVWFVDPTPADDVEFAGTLPGGHDLLSVARHEIAHAIGWVRESARVANLVSGNVFDPERLNIAIEPNGMHTDPAVHVDDLMQGAIGPSTRRPIRLYPDSALLARAFYYDISMRFVDGGYAGFETGSANAPWNTLLEAIWSIPADYSLLMIPRTYRETTPLVLNRPMVIGAARGGDVEVTGP
jgi:hypothetical protein